VRVAGKMVLMWSSACAQNCPLPSQQRLYNALTQIPDRRGEADGHTDRGACKCLFETSVCTLRADRNCPP
jgi:hypothetical protein